MNFEQWISIGSLAVSALAIICSQLNVRLQLKHAIKSKKYGVKEEERKKVARFLGYCKKIYNFGITESEMVEFSTLYIETQAIENEEMRQLITKCCDSVMTNSDSLAENFANCVQFYKSVYKSDL